jgi:hypothetical protein
MIGEPVEIPYIVYTGDAAANEWARTQLAGSTQVLERVNYPTNPTTPSVLRISHNTVGKGLSLRDRHLVRFETPIFVDNVQTGTASLYTVADFPRNGMNAEIAELLWKQLLGMLGGSSGNTAYGFAPDDYQAFVRGLLF